MTCAVCFRSIYSDEFSKCKLCGIKAHIKCFTFVSKKYCLYCQYYIKKKQRYISNGKCLLCPVNCGLLIRVSDDFQDKNFKKFLSDSKFESECTFPKDFNTNDLWVHYLCAIHNPKLSINALIVSYLEIKLFRNV